jgi:hypothetical protein
MAFEGLAKIKQLQERLTSRMHSMKAKAEKAIEQSTTVVEVNATLFGWGYVNEAFGEAPKDDPSGFKEYKLLGVPADLGAGLALLGVSFFGGLGKYDSHGINIGASSTGGFSYRLGAEMGRRSESAKGHPVATKGAAPQVTGRAAGPQGGRMHHVEYART